MAPNSATAKALDYSLKRWVALTRFVDDAQLPVDNNWIENQIRPVAIGRNNWLFAGSLRAGQRSAAVMSLIQRCQTQRHDPYAYLRDVLTRLPTHKASPHRGVAAAPLAGIPTLNLQRGQTRSRCLQQRWRNLPVLAVIGEHTGGLLFSRMIMPCLMDRSLAVNWTRSPSANWANCTVLRAWARRFNRSTTMRLRNSRSLSPMWRRACTNISAVYNGLPRSHARQFMLACITSLFIRFKMGWPTATNA